MLFVFKKDAPTLVKGKTLVRIVTYNEVPPKPCAVLPATVV